MWHKTINELPERGRVVDIWVNRRLCDWVYLSSLGQFRSKSTGLTRDKCEVNYWRYVPNEPGTESDTTKNLISLLIEARDFIADDVNCGPAGLGLVCMIDDLVEKVCSDEKE